MEENDYYNIITLQCIDCENKQCSMHPVGKMVYENQGCMRKIPEDLYIDYEHLIKEEAPFLRQLPTEKSVNKLYDDIMDMLEKIYRCPFVHSVGKSGRITKTEIPDEKLEEWNKNLDNEFSYI